MGVSVALGVGVRVAVGVEVDAIVTTVEGVEVTVAIGVTEAIAVGVDARPGVTARSGRVGVRVGTPVTKGGVRVGVRAVGGVAVACPAVVVGSAGRCTTSTRLGFLEAVVIASSSATIAPMMSGSRGAIRIPPWSAE